MCFDGIELEINSRSMSHLPQAPSLPAWSQKSPWPLSPPKAALTRHWRNTWSPNLRTVVGTCWKGPRLLSCWVSTFNRKCCQPEQNQNGHQQASRIAWNQPWNTPSPTSTAIVSSGSVTLTINPRPSAQPIQITCKEYSQALMSPWCCWITTTLPAPVSRFSMSNLERSGNRAEPPCGFANLLHYKNHWESRCF